MQNIILKTLSRNKFLKNIFSYFFFSHIIRNFHLLKISFIFAPPTQMLHPIFPHPEKIASEKGKQHWAEPLKITKRGTRKGKVN